MTQEVAKRKLGFSTGADKIIEQIYTDFKQELEKEYKRGRDDVLSRSCEGCKWDYKIENRDEGDNVLDSILPNSCYMCNRAVPDRWEQK